MKLKIVHLEGSRAGQTQELPGPVLALGRDPACHVAFDPVKDERVSGRHATLTIQGQNVVLMDTGSKNGTYVNGQKITQPLLLAPNAVIQLGDVGPKIMVSLVPDAPAPTPAPAAPAPAAPAAPAKSGGSGKLVFCCLLFFMLLLCVGGGVGVWYWKTHASNEVPKDKTPDQPSEDKKPDEPVGPKASAWSKLPIGTVIEVKMSNEMKTPAMRTSSVMKYTVKERNDENTVCELETVTTANGSAMPPTVTTQPFPNVDPPPTGTPDASGEKPTITKEAIEVAGWGKVECTKTTVRSVTLGVEKSRTETWMDSKGELPLPVRMVSQTPLSMMRSEISKVTKPK